MLTQRDGRGGSRCGSLGGRNWVAICAALFAFALAPGCGEDGNSAARSTGTSEGSGSPVDSVTTTAPTSEVAAPPEVDGLTAFGASTSAWNANHKADGRFGVNQAYDPDPRLPNPNFNSRYRTVNHSSGRVIGYEMQLPLRTTLSAARAIALKEFPADSRIRWEASFRECAYLQIQSGALASALSSLGAESGIATAVFFTEVDGDLPPLDPRNVTRIGFSLLTFDRPTSEADANC